MSSNNKIPAGWSVGFIDELMLPSADGRTLHQGWSPQCEAHPSRSDSEWGVLKTTAIQDGTFLPEHNKQLPDHLTPRPDIEVKKGDILITCAGPRVRCGIACLVRKTRPRLMLSGKMYRFRVPQTFISSEYIELYLRSVEAQAAIDRMKTGGSDSGLNLTHARFKTLQVRLPPFAEQQRIAQKVIALFSEIDKAIENFELARQQLRVYRTALMKQALEGQLTGRWRGKRKIKAESKVESKVTCEPLDGLTVPTEWRWTKLSNLLSFGPRNGFSPKPVKHKTGVKSLTLTATTSGKFDPTQFKYIEAEIDDDSHLWLNNGDILIQRGNTIEYVGTAAVYKGPAKTYIYPDLMMKLVPSDDISVEYLEVVLNSPWARQFLRDRATGTAGSMPKINKQTVESIPVPLCSLDEQEEIVELLQSRFSVCDNLNATIEKALLSASVLKKTILKSAFDGKLSRQDPNDEPAAMLLARLKSELAQSNNGKRAKNFSKVKVK